MLSEKSWKHTVIPHLINHVWKVLSLLLCYIICRRGIVWCIQCVCLWSEKANSCCLLGADKLVDTTDLVSTDLWEIIIVSGKAEWSRKTGAQQMWGLVRNFICHCTLRQTSLLIRSPWIRLGIWAVCSWTDWMVSFWAAITTRIHMHTLLHFISSLFELHYTSGMQISVLLGGCWSYHSI